MSYRSPRFIPQDTGQAWSTVTKAGVDAAATIAKKKADHAESERLRGEEIAKAGNLEQQSFIDKQVKHGQSYGDHRGAVDTFFDGWSQKIGDLKMATMGTEPKCAQEGFEFGGVPMSCDEAKNKLAVMRQAPDDMKTFIEDMSSQLSWKDIKNFDAGQNPDMLLAAQIFEGKGEFADRDNYNYEIVEGKDGGYDMVFYAGGKEVTRLNNQGLGSVQGDLWETTASQSKIANGVIQYGNLINNAEFTEDGEYVQGSGDLNLREYLPQIEMIEDPDNPGEEIPDPDQNFEDYYEETRALVDKGPPKVYDDIWVMKTSPGALLNNAKFMNGINEELEAFIGNDFNNQPRNDGQMKTYWNKVLRIKSNYSVDAYDEDIAKAVWGEGDHRDKWSDAFGYWDKDREISESDQLLFEEIFRRNNAQLASQFLNGQDPVRRQINHNEIQMYPGFLEISGGKMNDKSGGGNGTLTSRKY
tara:strand:- start:9984 stop:11393 length:1410 start_codon:yes stop_codon:yes gene_type:complete